MEEGVYFTILFFQPFVQSLAWLEFQQRQPQFLFCQLRSSVLQVTMLRLLYSCNLRNYLFRSCSFDNHCSHLYKDEAVCVRHIHRVSQRLSGKIVQVGSTLSCWGDGVCRGWSCCQGSLPTYSDNLDRSNCNCIDWTRVGLISSSSSPGAVLLT